MEKIGKLFEGGAQIRELLMAQVINQGGMDRAALVFGMIELIVDLKPEDTPMGEWVNRVAEVLGHFVRQKNGCDVRQ